jgi:hypothetical protein
MRERPQPVQRSLPPVVYSSPAPQGAGANPGGKAIPCAAPSLGGTCFANMRSAADLDSLQASNPFAADHQARMNRVIARGRIKAEQKAGIRPSRINEFISAPPRRVVYASFSQGATVKDINLRRKGIIIKANAGYTAKSHKPVHKVCDEGGNTWYAKEKDLKLLH